MCYHFPHEFQADETPLNGPRTARPGLESAGWPKMRRNAMFDYPVTLTPDDDGVLATFADVPEAASLGADEAEALLNAVDALGTGLSFYIDERRPLPMPGRPGEGQKTVRPSALECAKLGVYQAMIEEGVKKSELARRMGWHMPQIDRLLDLNHASRLDQIEAAARALGKSVTVRVA
jgi:antitoxin HicB